MCEWNLIVLAYPKLCFVISSNFFFNERIKTLIQIYLKNTMEIPKFLYAIVNRFIHSDQMT